MTDFNVTAKFALTRSTDNKEAVREAVKEALVRDLEERGYIVVDGEVEVRVSEPRRRPRKG